MRLASLSAVGRDVGKLARDMAAQVRAHEPDALLWLTDAARAPEQLARALSDECEHCVGGVSVRGLIGGGTEERSGAGANGEEARVVALALKAAPKGETDADVHALPFYSPPDGLPELPATSWATWAAAPPARSPHMMLLASPPRDGAFALESWLGRLDSTLPWARKVGGLLAGDGRLFEGSNEHNGGAVGLAIAGVQMDALCCQGALPVGPSFEITSSEANIIRELDGRDVAEAVHDILAQFSEPPRAGNQAPGARLQLHAFSAANARSEVQAAAAALASRQTGGYAGGLMVACVGRGAALYGEEGVESAELERAIGKPLALTGFFAGGEIGPVGSRTFVHTYTTTVGLLREQA